MRNAKLCDRVGTRVGVVALFVAVCGAGGLLLRTQATAQVVAAQVSGAQRVASVDMLVLVERVALLPKYGDVMRSMTAERAKELRVIVEEQGKLEEQARDLDKQSEPFKALQTRYMTLEETFKARQAEVQAEVEKLTATQVQQAYGEVLQAVQAHAKERGYTHVLASRKADAAFRAQDFANTLQEVLARGVVLSPNEDDLTEAMIDALGVRGIDPAAAGQVETGQSETTPAVPPK